MNQAFFVRFAGNSFHPKWPKLISLRPKLISPRPKLISPNTKNLFSKARNSFPETETPKFSRFCVFCMQKWHSKGQKSFIAPYIWLFSFIVTKRSKFTLKEPIKETETHFKKAETHFQKGETHFTKCQNSFFRDFARVAATWFCTQKKPANLLFS